MLEEAGDLVLQSNVVNNLGIEAYYAGRWDEASELYRRSGELSRRAGDVVNVARAENNEGEILSDQGKLEEAEALFLGGSAGLASGAVSGRHRACHLKPRPGRRSRKSLRRGARVARGGAGGLRGARLGGVPSRKHRARRAECLVLAGRYKEALDIAPGARGGRGEPAPRARSSSGSTDMRSCQARRAEEAGPRFERSLELARELDADYEVALTLEALGRTRLGDPEAEAESRLILERLGVLSTPRVPLP